MSPVNMSQRVSRLEMSQGIISDGGASLDVPDFQSNMPAFGSVLSDAEIRAVIEYLKSTWPEQEREAQWLASQNDPHPAPEP